VSSGSPPDAAAADAGPIRVTAHVRGHVQGVGFRWWTRCRARELGLVGVARNLRDGRVEVVAEGPAPAVRELVRFLGEESVVGRPGNVTGLSFREDHARGGMSRFVEE
jgi:acylphosphatase